MCRRPREKKLPDIAVDELTGDVDRYKDFFIALEKTSPVPIGFEKNHRWRTWLLSLGG